MASSPILKLPQELRDQIYEHVLIIPGGVKIDLSRLIRDTHIWRDVGKSEPCLLDLEGSSEYKKHFLAIAQVCKWLRHETLKIFHKQNRFVLSNYDAVHKYNFLRCPGVDYWLQPLGYRTHDLRHLAVDLKDWEALDFVQTANVITALKGIKSVFQPLNVRLQILMGVVPAPPLHDEGHGQCSLDFATYGPAELRVVAEERIEIYREECARYPTPSPLEAEKLEACIYHLECLGLGIGRLLDVLEMDSEWTWKPDSK